MPDGVSSPLAALFRRPAVLAAVLALGVLVLYAPVRHHEFVAYDDDEYVTANPHLRLGLSPAGLLWAIRSTDASNWHPLTWLSHLLDYELFGLDAGAHHMTSVVLHALSAVLLFLALRLMTDATFRSAAVAALFAVHPLNVQSVAWVAERKNVLSTTAGLLAILAYAAYARGGRKRWLAAATVLGGASLASKPMLVTLPFVLLLLDAWPLRRLATRGDVAADPDAAIPAPDPHAATAGGRKDATRKEARRRRRSVAAANAHAAEAADRGSASDAMGARVTSWRTLVLEKVPLLLLATACSVITVVAQRRGASIIGLEAYPLDVRLANAAVATVTYLRKMAWPADLAVFYPHPGDTLPAWHVLLAAAVIAAVSAVALRGWRQRPYLLVGWLFYLGTLVPVIGIVQVGTQAMADRYAYVSLIGIFIALVWGAADLARTARAGQAAAAALAVALAILAVRTRTEIHAWRDSRTLFTHTVAVEPGAWPLRLNLGNIHLAEGRPQEAVEQYLEGVRVRPHHAPLHSSLGDAYDRLGRAEEAVAAYREALRLEPDSAATLNNLGATLAALGRRDESRQAFEDAVRVRPDFAEALVNLAISLRAAGRLQEAEERLRRAALLRPDLAVARVHLVRVLIARGDTGAARAELEGLRALSPRDADALEPLLAR